MQLHYRLNTFCGRHDMTDCVLEVSSTLTDRYQTTVPEAVRQSLQLNRRDRIRYQILSDGGVLLQREEPAHNDPVVAKFTSFLAADMQNHPENVMLMDERLVESLRALTAGVELDLDAPLPADCDD
jgi:antitoxin PrlF